jgi:hypothetical protein
LWRGRQDQAVCFALDLKLLPVEDANQVIRLLEAEVDQGSAIQAYGLAVGGVVDRPASQLWPQVMTQPRSGRSGGREALTHAAQEARATGRFRG